MVKIIKATGEISLVIIIYLVLFSRAYVSDLPLPYHSTLAANDSLHMYNALENEVPISVLMRKAGIN
jgi:hypothetical protein